MNNFKLRKPCRSQMEMRMDCLDQLIPLYHRARCIWEFVDMMDTTPCFAKINTFQGEAGRSATSPKVLFALWLYSILDGNSSSRKLEELCNNHNAYKWIAGGVPINRTMLADFRSNNPSKFEDLLTNCLAVMIKTGLIRDEDFSQDGTRVKSNAGFGSYRREDSLQELKAEMTERIKQLDAENTISTHAYDTRKRVAQERFARERMEKINEALESLEKARREKEENGKKYRHYPAEEELQEVRASTTDPDVRKMKMGDGGFRLAYNVQFATGMDSRVIYGVDVVNTLDPGTAPRMMAKVHAKLNKLNQATPRNWIGDAAYSRKEDVEVAAQMFPNCRYYAPPKTRKGIDPKKHLKNDSEAVKKWRDMIGKEEVEEIYGKRCSTAEFSNAQIKNRGLREFLVRGLAKVKGQAILHAIAQNASRFIELMSRKERAIA